MLFVLVMMMGTELLRLITDDIGGTRLRFSGAKYFYGDRDVKGIIGIKPVTDRDNTRDKLKPKNSQMYKMYLVRLTAVATGQVAGGTGTNQAQRDKKFRINFYCHPEKVEDAILKLPGKSVDRGAGIGSLKIDEVYRARKIQYI